MKQRTRAFGAALFASSLILVGCSSSGDGNGDAGQIVIYSPNTDSENQVLTEMLLDEFPGIDIEIVTGGTGELTARIRAETANPQGDIMWGGLTMQDGDAHLDLFEEWLTEHEETVQEQYRSPNGVYSMDTVQTVVFAVNTDIEAELGLDITGYADLLDPALAGKVIMADPASSSSAWNNLSNIHAVFGNGSDETWDYVDRLFENDLVIGPGSSSTFASVADGEYAVGLTWESALANLVKAGVENVRMVYPEEGTSTLPYATAIVKDAPNMELAKEVVTYVMSPEGQIELAERDGTRRATTAAEVTTEFIAPESEITWVERDWEWLADNQFAVIEDWMDVYTRHRG